LKTVTRRGSRKRIRREPLNEPATSTGSETVPLDSLWHFLVLIGLFAFAPIGSVILCSVIANACGCKVDEGSVHPCIINGHDYGHLLYSLGVLGWLMLVTIPGGLFAFVVWFILLILHRASWRKPQSAPAATTPPIPQPPATA
jgi:hypothetical protein